MGEDDVLVGLKFEVSGGLGRMSGRVVGKAGPLYLVQKQGAEHLELLALDDLRSAKFFRDSPAELAEPAHQEAASESAQIEPEAAQSPKRRLSEQIRKHLGGD